MLGQQTGRTPVTSPDTLDLGFDVPARPGMTEAEVLTPALVLDLAAFERNLGKMQDRADAAGMKLRPHGKMHKSPWVAERQLAFGATGICCQKVSEAEAFVRAGILDVLVTNQVRQPAMLDRLARLARGAKVALCVDDPGGVEAAATAAFRQDATLRLLVEVDVGAGRCGVQTPDGAVALADMIRQSEGLRFAGIQAYHGAAQHLPDAATRKEAIALAAARLKPVLAALKAAGIPCPVVTGAGTGTFAHEAASGLWTELQCGSYAFMDADYTRAIGPEFEQALFVLTGVMSAPVPGRAVCDAGLKSLSVDSGLPLVSGVEGVVYEGASDEHGTLSDPALRLKPGDKLRLIPGHCDPTANLHDWIVGLRRGKVERLIRVAARGKSW